MADSDVPSKLEGVLKDLLSSSEKREDMRVNAKKLAVLDCDERICKAIDELFKSGT